MHPAAPRLVAACLTLALAGCFHSAHKTAPVAPPAPVPEQRAALPPDATPPKEELQEHCNQLAIATPGVEEFRIRNGAVESRQWGLVADGSAPRWAYVRTKNGAPDGWAPKPGLAKLDFRPPLEPALAAGVTRFLAYAPVDTDSMADRQKAATVREVFGAPTGRFTWRGQAYGYALTQALPCYPLLQ
jgi:hypothetical protein